MSYTKTTWETGDIITAEKLNNIEDGVADAGSASVLEVTYTEEEDTGILDKTWNEIKAAFPFVTIHFTTNGGEKDTFTVETIRESENDEMYSVRFGGGSYDLAATEPDGYPQVSYD